MLDKVYFGFSLHLLKVTLINVSSHIILNRFLAVELYFINYCVAFFFPLSLPFRMCIFFYIYILIKLRNPLCPGNFSQLELICPTFYFTSENATPRKEFNYLNTKQNWLRTSQNYSKGTYQFSLITLLIDYKHLRVQWMQKEVWIYYFVYCCSCIVWICFNSNDTYIYIEIVMLILD